MKKTLFSLIATVMVASAAGLTGTALLTAPAVAQSAAKATVDAAKAKGVVGEQSDGYLGLVKSADAATEAAVEEINAGRARVYAEAAAKNGVSPVAAGASAFTNIIFPKMKSGEYYKDEGGSWKQK